MDVAIRKMEPHEAAKTYRLAKRCFGLPESLFLPKPREGFVAVVGKEIIGGFAYNLEVCDSKKVAFVSLLFTDPRFTGQGIAKRLCTEGISHLWEQEGCDALVTYVRDDNVGSWSNFERNGFVKASLRKLARYVGFAGMTKLYIKTFYGMSIGHDFYVSLRSEELTAPYKKEPGSALQIAAYVLVNLFMVARVLMFADDALPVIWGYVTVFLGCALAGYMGTLLTKRKWSFRLPTGGLLMVPVGLLVIARGVGFIPMIANWYPHQYENTPEFKRDMAISSISVWAYLLALSAMNVAYTGFLVSFLLLLKCVFVPPFGSYGAERVYKWNKGVYMLLAIASVFVTYTIL